MIGCCGAQRAKFKSRSGEVDQARLDRIVAEKEKAGWVVSRVEKLKGCPCACHFDGNNVYC